MDGKPWPRGALTLAWMPEQDVGGTASKRSDELRIRASNLDLAAIEGLRSMAAKLSPDLARSGWLRNRAERSILWRWISRFRRRKNPFPGNMERSCLEAVEAAAGCGAL